MIAVARPAPQRWRGDRPSPACPPAVAPAPLPANDNEVADPRRIAARAWHFVLSLAAVTGFFGGLILVLEHAS